MNFSDSLRKICNLDEVLHPPHYRAQCLPCPEDGTWVYDGKTKTFKKVDGIQYWVLSNDV